MQQFKFLVTDRRGTAPTLRLVQARDERRARALALALLDEYGHCIGVAVWKDDVLLVEVGRTAADECL